VRLVMQLAYMDLLAAIHTFPTSFCLVYPSTQAVCHYSGTNYFLSLFLWENAYVRKLYGDEQNDDCDTLFNSWCDANPGQRVRWCWTYCAIDGCFIVIAYVTRIQFWICIVTVIDEGH
jgi:hypothetical protein